MRGLRTRKSFSRIHACGVWLKTATKVLWKYNRIRFLVSLVFLISGFSSLFFISLVRVTKHTDSTVRCSLLLLFLPLFLLILLHYCAICFYLLCIILPSFHTLIYIMPTDLITDYFWYFMIFVFFLWDVLRGENKIIRKIIRG